ncbi:MAG: 16S rRNA (guanine(966)-N(2))-methyltransferase RsmD [Defluviitaleaceae bacterium]|nr:16S rRNA (guanine(966)-N(2))-methyltransferase RsmD [Defluviitaleaceae bacterium]
MLPLQTDKVRPTTDAIKENLFNILQTNVKDCRFLDLFAGTGAIGIEALSRGAKHCIFVDASRIAVELVRKNLEKTNLTTEAEIIRERIPEVMPRLMSYKFDIIYLDPPYNWGLAAETLKGITSTDILDDGGIIIAEVASDEVLTPYLGFEIFKVKRYGGSKLFFIRRGE